MGLRPKFTLKPQRYPGTVQSGRNRKDEDPDPCFGIVSDAETWLFVKCTMTRIITPYSAYHLHTVSFTKTRRCHEGCRDHHLAVDGGRGYDGKEKIFGDKAWNL